MALPDWRIRGAAERVAWAKRAAAAWRRSALQKPFRHEECKETADTPRSSLLVPKLVRASTRRSGMVPMGRDKPLMRRALLGQERQFQQAFPRGPVATRGAERR